MDFLVHHYLPTRIKWHTCKCTSFPVDINVCMRSPVYSTCMCMDVRMSYIDVVCVDVIMVCALI